jgi:selenocysteine lyase/cysteine desulfurase
MSANGLRRFPASKSPIGERFLAAIATATVMGKDPQELVLALRVQGINLHASNRIAYFEGGGCSRSLLRISPHHYNTEDEIDRAIAALGELLAG